MGKIYFLIIGILFFIPQGIFADEIAKKADLAGSWYPADKKELLGLLEGYINQAHPEIPDGQILGLISPHAGYVYSGRTAGFGFRVVKNKDYKTVVIIGFSHRKFFKGVSVYGRGTFQTPLGEAMVDAGFAEELILRDENVSFYPDLFNDENSIEMIVPFVQASLPAAMIVPVCFGPHDYRMCEGLAAALADTIRDREDVLIIASTDMSHFHPYEEACGMDEFTIKKIEEFDVKGLYQEAEDGNAELCGLAPVITLMLAMQRLGADNVKILKYENSGDVTGDKQSVVGYVSAVFYKGVPKDVGRGTWDEKKEGDMLSDKQKKRLLEIARITIEQYVRMGKAPDFTETDPGLLKEKGAFVTLHYKGELRGCIGNIIGHGPLYKTVRSMAIESATNDPRFPAVTALELEGIKIEISVLSEPERVTDVNNIVMGRDGVIVKRGFHSGVFLPQVATETGWSREEFLGNLCSHKAGLPATAWKDPATELYSFTAEVFGEK